MKRVLHFIFAFLSVSLQHFAQTDVTHYIKNPDFEIEGTSGWINSGLGSQGNSSFTLKNGNFYAEIWTGRGNKLNNCSLQQTLSDLPAGTYTFTAAAHHIQEGQSTLQTGAFLFANNQQTEINAPDHYNVTETTVNGEITFGIKLQNSTGNWLAVDNFRLSYKIDKEALKPGIIVMLEEAGDIDKHLTTDEQKELDEAKAALEAYLSNSQTDGIVEAISRLKKAIRSYQLSIASEEKPFDMTYYLQNPSFERGLENWDITDMFLQNNDGLTIKEGSIYMEKWVGQGSKVGDAILSQQLTGLPNGTYILTAAAFNVQQGSSAKQTGVYLFADNVQTVVEASATYQVKFHSIDGLVRIGLQAQNATGNWIAVDNFRLYYVGYSFADDLQTLNQRIAEAEGLIASKMNTDTLAILKEAITRAKTISDNNGLMEAAGALKKAMESARPSIESYQALKQAIGTAQDALNEGGVNERTALEAAISAAQQLFENPRASNEELILKCPALDKAVLTFRLANATGSIPIVSTYSEVIYGCKAALGRLTVKGTNIIETGFCWSTHPNPTIKDNSSTVNYSFNGSIYLMDDLQPSTTYYVRAYAMTNNYAVGYGEVVRIITLPEAKTSYSYSNNGDAATNYRIDNAMKSAIEYCNIWTSIQGFHATANYSPGTPTADCSYGGWINVGSGTGYQRTGTMLHEIGHGIGVGQHWRWTSWDSPLHPTGDWTGERANRVFWFFENNKNGMANGDRMHVCYGINGGSDRIIDFIACVALYQGLYEDGLPAVYDGAAPYYSFESEDTIKYYLTNEKHGFNSKFLTENSAGKLLYQEIAPEEVIEDDSYAWFLHFDPTTALYRIKNAKSGKYFTCSGSTFMSKEITDLSANENFHLMPSRKPILHKVGNKEFVIKPYWIARGNRVENPEVLVVSSGATSSATTQMLDFTDNATSQHWAILNRAQIEETSSIHQQINKEKLERLIVGSLQLIQTEHLQETEGADENFYAQVQDIERKKETLVTAAEIEDAVNDLYKYITNYLTQVNPVSTESPFDLTFLIDDASFSTGIGWDGISQINDSIIEFSDESFHISQTIPKLPKGTYALHAQTFQRPGPFVSACRDYANGKNNVSAQLIANSKKQLIKHIAEGAQDQMINEGGLELLYSEKYHPYNIGAARIYLKKGFYRNSVVFRNILPVTLTIGLQNTSSISDNWIVMDGFQLYYYGNDVDPDDITAIEVVTEDVADGEGVVQGYYSLSGVRLTAPLEQGITIVKYEDGRTVKIIR